MLINRAMEGVSQDKITPGLYREVVSLVVRLREQKISMERLRFELEVAGLVMKHIDRLKSFGVLQIEDRGEAAKKNPRTHVRQIHQGANRGRRVLKHCAKEY